MRGRRVAFDLIERRLIAEVINSFCRVFTCCEAKEFSEYKNYGEWRSDIVDKCKKICNCLGVEI